MFRETLHKILHPEIVKIRQPVITYTYECSKGFLGFFKKRTLAFTVMTEPGGAPAADVDDVVSVKIINFNKDGTDEAIIVFVTDAKHNSADVKAPGKTNIRGIIVE